MHSISWKTHITRMVLTAALVLIIGWISGYLLPVLTVALAVYAVWNLLNLWRFYQWLNFDQLEPPESLGLWADIFAYIHSLRKQSQKKRQLQKDAIEEFMAVTNAFPDASLVIDTDDTITWFNEAAQNLLGLQIETDLGQAITNLIRDPNFADWLAVQDQVSSKLEMPGPHDQTVHLAVSASQHSNKQRLLVLRDVTDVYNLEKIRRDFVANVSHELRTPLTVILGYLESLAPDCPESMAGAVNRMQSQAHQMNALITDLIELSRLQSDEHASGDENIDVAAMIVQLVELAGELSQGNHEIVMDIDDDLKIWGIEADLESAFRNLIQNAVYYTPDNGRVVIRWALSGDGPVFSVSDTGTGIPKKDLARLTERFYRVGSDRSRQSGGTGLGLSIVKHVLNAHGASLIIESELGEGSRFTCQFPPDCIVDPG